jgi:hypothetical protein
MAKLRYKSKPKTAGGGKKFFFSMLTVFIILIGGWFLILPTEFNKCETNTSSAECGCPTDKESISKKNIILIDVTDQIATGKFPDIKNLINSYALRPEPFLSWMANGKKVEMTSIFLLSDKIPAEMLPVVNFCRLPPEISLISSTSNSKIKNLKERIKNNLSEVLVPLHQLNTAKASPIIETISVVTSNSTNWTPGGDLVIVSDMLQNSAECGWFEKMDSIPIFTKTPSSCKFYIDKFQANSRPTELYKGKTNIAVCLLPPIDGKKPKVGLRAYWHEFFQGVLSYDFLESCNPNEINNRKASLLQY